MGKAASVVDQIAAKIPKNQGNRPWWKRLTPQQEEMVDPIREAWRSGRFGQQKATASRAISEWLTEHGIKIGPQGVLAWLRRAE